MALARRTSAATTWPATSTGQGPQHEAGPMPSHRSHCTPSPGSWVSERNNALIKTSTRLSRNKVRTSLTAWTSPVAWTGLAAWLDRHRSELGRRLFADTDARARWQGWQVTAVQHGLGRQYRDPRFDSLIRCTSCGGRAETGGLHCAPCSGTGRRTRYPPAGTASQLTRDPPAGIKRGAGHG